MMHGLNDLIILHTFHYIIKMHYISTFKLTILNYCWKKRENTRI